MTNIPIIGGAHGIITGLDGCKWWAENGLICWEKLDGDYGTQSVKDTLERLQGINDLTGDHRFGKGFHTGSEVKMTRDFIDRMIEICKQAQIQGMPDDPTAVRDLKRRRKKSIRVPSKSSGF